MLTSISKVRKVFRSRRVAGRLTLLISLVSNSTVGMNWPHWRGSEDNGAVAEGDYPIKWETNQFMWVADLPGKGCSTPVTWDSRIFLTAPINGLDAVLAYNLNGAQLWSATFGKERPGQHRNGSGSNPSPVTDGQGVFVYFKSGAFAALDLNGHVRWQTNLVAAFGPDTLYWDQGTSPVLTDKHAIVVRMHQGESWLAAFDKATGQLRWKVDRNYETPSEGDHGYTTPILIKNSGKDSLLVWGAEHVTLHDPADGKLLWSCTGFNPDKVPNWPSVASPVMSGEVAIVACGRADRGQPRLYGIQLGSGGQETTNHLWQRVDTGTFVPTPALQAGRLYLLRDRGEVECLETTTGKTLWRDAIPKSSANYYASPLLAGGKLYAVREDGIVFVAAVKDKFELLAENKMGERIIASPIPLPKSLLFRGERHLFRVGF